MGETAGVRIPEAIQQVKNGTASITMDDRSFGQRYAYYARIVDQKVSESWNTQQIFQFFEEAGFVFAYVRVSGLRHVDSIV